MSCTPQEIAEKKRIALERLQAKRKYISGESNTVTKTKESNSFYGKSINENHQLNISKKVITNPYRNSRILSQPYQTSGSRHKSETPHIAPIPKLNSCTCYMIQENRFVVQPSAFYSKLIDVFKEIPSRNYDPSTKLWSFHLNHYNLVHDRVNNLRPDVVIGLLPKFVLNTFNEPEATASDISLSSLEKNLTNILMPFQKIGVRFGIEKKGRCMIADEMGLGKTYQALGLADFYKDDWPLLICTTASTRDSWQSKILEILPYVASHSIVCLTTTQDYIGQVKILIASYNIMERMSETLLKQEFGFVIFDESHLLKNYKAKITETALQLAHKARRVVLLTGTPALSRPLELFTQLQMIDPNFFNYKEYTTRYCAGKQTNFGWNATGQSNLNELNLVLSRKFMIRRTKQDVLTQLKEKFRETVFLDSALIWTDEDITENLKSYASDITKMRGGEKDDILLKFYNETAHAKTKAVCAYVEEMVKEKQKFIVFAHHLIMLDAISHCLEKLNVDFIRIDGSTKNEIRTMHVKRFQEVGHCLVALLSIKACNAGITLTAAQLVIFAELDWNPSILAQAESRAHRIGQEGHVTCRYLLAKGTADDVIWEMLKTKENVLNQAGIFNENLSNATNVIAPTTSSSLQEINTSDMMGSQSSLDDVIASICTDNVVAELDKNNCSEISTMNTLLEKQNLLSFLDGDDEAFIGLNY